MNGQAKALRKAKHDAEVCWNKREYEKALPLLELLAASGDISAMNRLGDMYHYGLGVERDYAISKEWIRKAAEHGNAEAMNRLGNMYFERKSGNDYATAREWYEKAAENGNAEAMDRLGIMYDLGRAVARDYGPAREWYEKAAENGNDSAMVNLAKMYLDGRGVEKNDATAQIWYAKAAEHGNYFARMRVKRDADAFLDKEEYEKALPLLESLAAGGDHSSMNRLGVMYHYGRGVERNYAIAKEWFERAAEKGDNAAMNNLGSVYRYGWGTEKDYAAAREWYGRAAENGYAGAMNNLGEMYSNGLGVERDYVAAKDWFEKAAERKQAYAMSNLGYLYEHGFGVEKNYAAAREWYEQAVENGNADAEGGLSHIKLKIRQEEEGIGKKTGREFSKSSEQSRKSAAETEAVEEEKEISEVLKGHHCGFSQSGVPYNKRKRSEEISMERERLEKIMSRFQSFALTPGSLREIENFFVFQSNYRDEQKRPLRYNLLIQCDERGEADELADAIREMAEWTGIWEYPARKVSEKKLLEDDKILENIFADSGLLFITGCEGVEKDSANIMASSLRADIERAKRKKMHKWDELVNLASELPNLPVIACGNKAFVDFIRESDELYYRFFAHHIFLRPMEEDEIIQAVLGELEKDGFSTTEAFDRKIDTYIRTVYARADLKGNAFVSDLINRIQVSYYLNPANHVITKNCVPFYRQTPSFDTVISRMNHLVGLKKVKEQFYELYKLNKDRVNQNKTRLHFAFVGNPGTGKSTVAALTADLLYSMGLIKKNKIVKVTAADIVSMYLGQWVVLLKEKIAEAQGGILFIDEAYFLIPGEDNSATQQKQCLNVLIQEMENNSDNISIIFAGYEDEIDTLFSANEGINSRVPYRFQFEDYTDQELLLIFRQMAERDSFSLDENALDAMMSRFALERAQENFGNARSVENIYQQVKSAWMDRAAEDRVILEEDIRKTMPVPLYTDLDDMIGLETVKRELNVFESRVKYIHHLTDNGLSVPASNMHMLFTGNPGTGKTTVAKKIADCLYRIGVLQTNKLVTAERKDLVSNTIGGTAKKTNEVIQKALNGVLFIDEAYSLYRPDNPRDVGSEVIETLITAMEKHKGSLVVIFAGYRKEMMVFRQANSGITSRIGFSFDFPDYSPDELTQIYFRKMKNFGFALHDDVREPVYRLMESFSARENFGNG
ncbi:MAG: AAA family ATPase, partial [Lachnospiraceae bacterium]|nr:AAA family ATPase [Lachnospiraceae bacterium]